MTSSFLQFWNKFRDENSPYFHPADDGVLFAPGRNDYLTDTIGTFRGYAGDEHFARRGSARLDLSLLPIPYGGNLEKADIVILLLNPGLSYTDYYGEFERPEFRRALTQNLRQDFSGTEYPFPWLNPEFCWHEGFMWWEQKLRPVLRAVAEQKFKGSYMKALHFLSGRLGMVELVPYHSGSAPAGRLIRGLPSVRAARDYVQQTLLPAAKAGGKLLIVTRQAQNWGITADADGIVVYGQHEARGASLSPKSKGGAAILRRLGVKV